jgi:hypothetical protein
MDKMSDKFDINSRIEVLRRLGTPEDIVGFLLDLSDVDLEKFLTTTLLTKKELVLILTEVMEAFSDESYHHFDLKYKDREPAVQAKEFKYLSILHENIKYNFAKLSEFYQRRIVVYYQLYGKKQEALELIPFTDSKRVLIGLGAPICYRCIYYGEDISYNPWSLRCSVHPTTDIVIDEVNNNCSDFSLDEDLFLLYLIN